MKTATISQNMVEEEEEQSTNVFDLFRPRKMLLRTLNMFFQVLSIHQFFFFRIKMYLVLQSV